MCRGCDMSDLDLLKIILDLLKVETSINVDCAKTIIEGMIKAISNVEPNTGQWDVREGIPLSNMPQGTMGWDIEQAKKELK